MTSVVDWHCNKEHEFHAEFVSVMDLIDHLATSKAMTVQKVAEALLHFFGQFQPEDRPRYGFANEIDCGFVEIDRVVESDHLDDLLSVTASSVEPCYADTSDHFGWVRKELFEFMKANKIEPPNDLPCWRSHHMSGGRQDAPIKGAHGVHSAFNDNSYSTPLLKLQNAAIDKFYAHRSGVDPKKDDIINWLISAGKELDLEVSRNVAEAMFTIIKPKDHDPRKRRG